MRVLILIGMLILMCVSCGDESYYSGYSPSGGSISCWSTCWNLCDTCNTWDFDIRECTRGCDQGCRIKSCDTFTHSYTCEEFFQEVCIGDN
jgi:hypothetical protein